MSNGFQDLNLDICCLSGTCNLFFVIFCQTAPAHLVSVYNVGKSENVNDISY